MSREAAELNVRGAESYQGAAIGEALLAILDVLQEISGHLADLKPREWHGGPR